MRNSKVQSDNNDDLAEKIRVFKLILATFIKIQNHVFAKIPISLIKSYEIYSKSSAKIKY
jgi:hypothetical protein